MSTARIIVVEDVQRIGSGLLRALTSSGYDTTWERSGRAGRAGVAAYDGTRPGTRTSTWSAAQRRSGRLRDQALRLAELLARVGAQLRHADVASSGPRQVGNLRIDRDARRVRRGEPSSSWGPRSLINWHGYSPTWARS